MGEPMHRRPLRDALDQYPMVWSLEGAQSAIYEQFVEFVSSEPRCFERSHATGHVTASAFICDAKGEHVLLTQHKKLDKWLQLGGHADGETDPIKVAQREGLEESGLPELYLIDCCGAPFDLDIHKIPARAEEPEHLHYDLRYLFVADIRHPLTVSDESHDLKWISHGEAHHYTDEESLLRLFRKLRKEIHLPSALKKLDLPAIPH